MRDLIRCFWVAGSLRMALCSCGKSLCQHVSVWEMTSFLVYRCGWALLLRVEVDVLGPPLTAQV